MPISCIQKKRHGLLKPKCSTDSLRFFSFGIDLISSMVSVVFQRSKNTEDHSMKHTVKLKTWHNILPCIYWYEHYYKHIQSIYLWTSFIWLLQELPAAIWTWCLNSSSTSNGKSQRRLEDLLWKISKAQGMAWK